MRVKPERSQNWLILRALSVPAAVAILALAGGCRAPLVRHEFTEAHLGTSVRLVVYGADGASVSAAAARAFRRVEEIEQALSDYRPLSEASQLVRQHGEPVPVGADLFRVLEESLSIAGASRGAFDPTVGPYVQLWRRAKRQGELPRPRRLAEVRPTVGYSKIQLDPKAQTVRLVVPNMQLDFGGIGKGYAAEEALRVLESAGYSVSMVDAGGDVVTGDAPPGQSGWRISLPIVGRPGDTADGGDSAPLEPGILEPAILERLEIERLAVATSGDAFQYLEVDGVRYSHIIDPRTGLGIPAPGPSIVRSVTVVAPRGSTADALASALSVLSTEDGLALVADRPGVATRIVLLGDGPPRVVESPSFRSHTVARIQ